MAGIIAPRSLAAAMAAVATSALAGCIVYPVYKTLQPATQVTVVDERGAPLAGAEVTLISGAYPYGREKSRLTRSTDAAGRVAFDRVSEWRGEMTVIHGWEEYYWNLCVRRAGFGTHETHHRSAEHFATDSVVTLAVGAATPCEPPPAAGPSTAAPPAPS